MKKSGFTLVELLGVIVILSLLTLIVFPNIIGLIKKSSNEVDDLTIELIYNAADKYVNNDKDHYSKKNNNVYCIGVNELIINDYIKESELLETVKNTKTVKVTYKNSFKYELVDNGSCREQFNICEAVTNKNKTAGNIPKGNYEVGDEYICEVKPGTKYHFFVVSQDEKKVNLLMDSNVNSDGEAVNSSLVKNNGIVAWISENDFNEPTDIWKQERTTKGPITALKYLNDATESWKYITNLDETYTDTFEQKDESNNVITYTVILNQKARLLYKNEIGCLVNAEGTEADICPKWMTTNLEELSFEPSECELYDTTKIRCKYKGSLGKVYGYWTMHAYNLIDSYNVNYNGTDLNGTIEDNEFLSRPIGIDYIGDFEGEYGDILIMKYIKQDKINDYKVPMVNGVRPVISVEKSRISN